MIEQLWRASLQQPHELIYPELETVELIRIHVMVLIVHEMLEDEVYYVRIVSKLKNVLTEVVHTLEVSVIRVIEGKGVEDLYHFAS